jgi:hypothetical protein
VDEELHADRVTKILSTEGACADPLPSMIRSHALWSTEMIIIISIISIYPSIYLSIYLRPSLPPSLPPYPYQPRYLSTHPSVLPSISFPPSLSTSPSNILQVTPHRAQQIPVTGGKSANLDQTSFRSQTQAAHSRRALLRSTHACCECLSTRSSR